MDGSAPEQPKIIQKPLTPEDIGFRRLEGIDFFRIPSSALHKTGMNIDNTEERRSKFALALKQIGKVAGDPEKKNQAVKKLTQSSHETRDRTYHPENIQHLVKTYNFVGDVISNWHDKSRLAGVLKQVQTEEFQENIGMAKDRISFGDDPALSTVVHGVIELSQMLYAQEHGGTPYETSEHKKNMLKMMEQVKGFGVNEH